ncbi:hypothetical protein [Hydrogeniiclostridium mannosilyticum]|uniref:hypothetical protein n=1 Tax=Hydrogeniiclostridium mannosilyticum TaxID=2764322 RepID=UPI0018A9DAA2|nr:hypothetical protein [Hydrogeniiclostridium mannosilyticum]
MAAQAAIPTPSTSVPGKTSEVSAAGQTFTIEEFNELAGDSLTNQADLTIVLNGNGSCEVKNAAGTSGTGKWTEGEGKITIKDSASTIELTEEDGLLVMEQSGTTFKFKKQ